MTTRPSSLHVLVAPDLGARPRLRRRRNPPLLAGGALALALVALAGLAPLIAPYDPTALDPAGRLAPPGGAHLLGTDRLGRDVASRLLHGGRVAMAVGATAVLIGAGAGVPLGLVSGYRGGWLDGAIMRVMDGLVAFPALLLAIMMIAALGPGHVQAMLAIGIVLVPVFARLSRAQALAVRHQEYVLAARALGAPERRIVMRHVLPNIAGPLLVQGTVAFSGAVLAEASLSYLGLGTQPPTPSWGGMLQEARDVFFIAWWMAIWPGVAIAAAVLGLNLLGDGLRDLLDPRLRGGLGR
ncbi:MAG: ABC transporter permease [Armatimonadota bacterium]|nr:ABC transporter permease [Armatimonadota bacterium]MDR7485706.1 ABC transporter permease [Armatimonadota bacterium]MDR7533099.1 ABC transporter permease [Armatimonadota bacterium]MDR7535869.1 ABC transporter permease [Armatimonadota bacterium]